MGNADNTRESTTYDHASTPRDMCQLLYNDTFDLLATLQSTEL